MNETPTRRFTFRVLHDTWHDPRGALCRVLIDNCNGARDVKFKGMQIRNAQSDANERAYATRKQNRELDNDKAKKTQFDRCEIPRGKREAGKAVKRPRKQFWQEHESRSAFTRTSHKAREFAKNEKRQKEFNIAADAAARTLSGKVTK